MELHIFLTTLFIFSFSATASAQRAKLDSPDAAAVTTALAEDTA